MRLFWSRRKKGPENGPGSTKQLPRPPWHRRGILVFALFTGLAVGGSFGVHQLAKSNRRPVLQCKYDVKGRTIIQRTRLSIKEARNIKLQKNCKKELCSVGYGCGTPLFFNCKPLTEEKLATMDGKWENGARNKALAVIGICVLAFAALVWRLGAAVKRRIQRNYMRFSSDDPNN